MNLHLYYIIVGTLVFLSTLVMTIWFKTNRILNIYLVFTSVILCLYLILYGIKNKNGYYDICPLWNFNYYQVVLVLTPCVYLFFEKILSNIKFCEKKDVYYLIVPIIFYYYIGKEEYNYSIREEFTVFVLFIIYISFYSFRSYVLLSNTIWHTKLKKEYEILVVNWTSFIFYMMLVVLVHFVVTVAFHVLKINQLFNPILEAIFLIIFLIGYFKVIFTPELFYGSSRLKKITDTNTISKLNLSTLWYLELDLALINEKDAYLTQKVLSRISEYIQKIEHIAITEFAFRKKDYSIKDLSTHIGIPKSHLDYIFKYHCTLSFNDYKRFIRIYDSVQLINDDFLKSNTLDSLANYVGFSSYNPFLLNFKQVTGVPPFDFHKNRKFENITF